MGGVCGAGRGFSGRASNTVTVARVQDYWSVHLEGALGFGLPVIFHLLFFPRFFVLLSLQALCRSKKRKRTESPILHV